MYVFRDNREMCMLTNILSIYQVPRTKATKMRKTDFLPLRGLFLGPGEGGRSAH